MKVKKFSISNYKSLKSITIPEFDLATIFFGENNAGKSNILSALKLIFARKQKFDEERTLTHFENFYEGVILQSKSLFFDNNTADDIDFTVELEVNKADLSIDESIQGIFGNEDTVLFTFVGKISFDHVNEGNNSDFRITEIKVGATTIYQNSAGIAYFPTIPDSEQNQSQLSKTFAKLINIFNDCVYIVVSDRDMHDAEMGSENETYLSPKTFKRFLYSLYLSEDKFPIFEEINNVFKSEPFSFGEVSFSKDGEKRLEIMVKENSFRLPIKNLGSGTLQSLYIIAAIVSNKKKIICIEELEQNLSPRKQYAIFEKIKGMIGNGVDSLLAQVIISSHSLVFANPDLGTIYVLEKADGETVINKKEAKEKGSKKMVEHFAPAVGSGRYKRRNGWDLI